MSKQPRRLIRKNEKSSVNAVRSVSFTDLWGNFLRGRRTIEKAMWRHRYLLSSFGMCLLSWCKMLLFFMTCHKRRQCFPVPIDDGKCARGAMQVLLRWTSGKLGQCLQSCHFSSGNFIRRLRGLLTTVPPWHNLKTEQKRNAVWYKLSPNLAADLVSLFMCSQSYSFSTLSSLALAQRCFGVCNHPGKPGWQELIFKDSFEDAATSKLVKFYKWSCRDCANGFCLNNWPFKTLACNHKSLEILKGSRRK